MASEDSDSWSEFSEQLSDSEPEELIAQEIREVTSNLIPVTEPESVNLEDAIRIRRSELPPTQNQSSGFGHLYGNKCRKNAIPATISVDVEARPEIENKGGEDDSAIVPSCSKVYKNHPQPLSEASNVDIEGPASYTNVNLGSYINESKQNSGILGASPMQGNSGLLKQQLTSGSKRPKKNDCESDDSDDSQNSKRRKKDSSTCLGNEIDYHVFEKNGTDVHRIGYGGNFVDSDISSAAIPISVPYCFRCNKGNVIGPDLKIIESIWCECKGGDEPDPCSMRVHADCLGFPGAKHLPDYYCPGHIIYGRRNERVNSYYE